MIECPPFTPHPAPEGPPSPKLGEGLWPLAERNPLPRRRSGSLSQNWERGSTALSLSPTELGRMEVRVFRWVFNDIGLLTFKFPLIGEET